jgi:dolichyl-phosphate beta-glucosyltransferase
MPTLSIVIPAFNERKRLPRALDAIRRYASSAARDWEVIVVDDGSSDGTPDLVREYAGRWPRLRLVEQPRNRGKGAAVKAGIAASLAPIVGFTDADLAAPIEQVDLLLADLADAEVAITSRALRGASLGNRQSLPREAMGHAYSKLTEALLLRGVPDAQCGLKLYRASAAREIFLKVAEDGIIFDTEVLVVATQRGFRISQRPVVWNHDPDSRIRFSIPMAVDVALALLRVKVRHKVFWPLLAVGPVRPAAPVALGMFRVPSGATLPQLDEVLRSASPTTPRPLREEVPLDAAGAGPPIRW